MKKAINQELMRTTNKGQILRCIKDKQVVSKKEIAGDLGLSTTTVSTFIRELEKEKLIQNGGIARSTGGRRSVLYQLNPDYVYTLGIDLKVDRLIGVLLDFRGEIRGIKETVLVEQDEWKVIPLLKSFIQEILDAHRLPFAQLGGIGIGVPGVLNREASIIEFAPNLGWRNVDLPTMLALDKPVYLENEANAGALGEMVFGVAKNVSHLVYISVGMGIGCGLLIDNKLFAGYCQQAGEFGHMVVEPKGLACRCGNRGCWEVYASNSAALRMYAQKNREISVSFQEFLQRCLGGEDEALEVLQTIVEYLGIGMANIINGLNPEMIVIGGELTEVKELIYNLLVKTIKERTLEKAFAGMRLEFSHLGNKAVALGMGSIVLDQMLNAVN